MAGEDTYRSRFPHLCRAGRILLASLAVLDVATGVAVPSITGDVTFRGPDKGQLHAGTTNSTPRDLWSGPGSPPKCYASGGRRVGISEFLGILGDRLSDTGSPVHAGDFQLWVADTVGCAEDLLPYMLAEAERALDVMMLKLRLEEERKARAQRQRQQEQEGTAPDRTETPWPAWVSGPDVMMGRPTVAPGEQPPRHSPPGREEDQPGETGEQEGGGATAALKGARVARANGLDPIMGLPSPTSAPAKGDDNDDDDDDDDDEEDRRVVKLYDKHGAWACTRLE